MTQRPTAVIACRVFYELLGSRLADIVSVAWLDVSLHNTPKKLAAALQGRADALAEPSNVIVGYGLCGNGLVGVSSREHMLIIPCMHDCVAMSPVRTSATCNGLFASPNTYYLTRGWLDTRDEPLTDYLDYVGKYDKETADYLVKMKCRHYRKLCMVGFSDAELAACRPAVMQVAAFCEERFGMKYEETVGTTEFMDALVQAPARHSEESDRFVIVGRDSEITADMFLRSGEAAPPAAERKGG